MAISDQILTRLQTDYDLTPRGEFMRGGRCPECHKKTLWCHAHEPRMVWCDRLAKCGYSAHVKELFEDLFKEWSREHPRTPTNPNAAADAYLRDGRGFDLTPLRGHYQQETYQRGELVSATVRFQLPGGIHWERLIDRPERFGNAKAHFNYGAKYQGQAWLYPGIDLASIDELWICEGIFDAIALSQSGCPAASCMSASNYPTHLLEQITSACAAAGRDRPRIIWAMDADRAGREALQKHHATALDAGWDSRAALPPSQTMGSSDWNDLFERGQLTPEHIRRYRHYGDVAIAKNPAEAGLLIYNFHDGKRRAFDFVWNLRTYWFELDFSKYSKAIDRVEKDFPDMDQTESRQQALQSSSGVTELCNAVLNPLYFQRNTVTDESAFFYQIRSRWGDVNLTFTPEQLATRSRFKPRIMAAGHGIVWVGAEDRLEQLVKRQNEGLREVHTIDYIGYSAEHRAYLFGNHAVQDGRIVSVNDWDFFKLGRLEIKSLAKQPDITLNPKTRFNPSWWDDFYRVRGAKGLIVLAWWTGSYFAEQIRAMHGSYPFIEVVGQAGAGKSRLIELLWKLSGRPMYEGFDPTKSSPVGIYRNLNQVSNLPVVLIEGDRNDTDKIVKAKFSWDELKNAFNGRSVRSRGIKSAGNETYEPPFRGAIMISQNTPIAASEAMLTRTLHLSFDRSGQTLKTKRLVDKLDAMPLDEACTWMTQALRLEKAILDTYRERLSLYEEEYHREEITHTRIALCHAQVAALIDAIAKHLLDGYIDLEHVTDAQDYLKVIARQRIQELSGDHPDIERFWDVFEYLHFGRGNQVNHHPAKAPTIAINLPEFYKMASEARQQLPDMVQLKALLPTSRRYRYVESNRAVRSTHTDITGSSSVLKCWVFEKAKDFEQGGTA